MMLFSTCSSPKNAMKTAEFKPLTKNVFILKPFGYEPTIKNFSTYLPVNYKQKIYTKENKLHPNITDSIYRFQHKKNQLFVYKTNSKREFFVAGNIYDSGIVLHNGVRVGMNRTEFFNCFIDLNFNETDTLRMTSKQAGNSYNFIFKNNVLTAIMINNKVD
jgi:hypothetical protein